MKYMHVVILSVFLLIQCLILSFPSKGQTIENLEVDKILLGPISFENSPGWSAAVVKDGKIIYEGNFGYADLDWKQEIDRETIFGLGSISKQFTAICIAILIERGQLNLHDDIKQYFPEFSNHAPPISIASLIYHTSGLKDYLSLTSLRGEDFYDPQSNRKVMEMILSQNLSFDPGTRFAYSNSGYFILSLLIEKISGMKINEFAMQNLFGPLKMDQTFFMNDHTQIIPNLAESYFLNADSLHRKKMIKSDIVGATGVYSNVRDMIRWSLFLQDGREAPKELQQIKKKYLFHKGKLQNNSSTDYTFGFYLTDDDRYSGQQMLSHSGTFGGFRSMMIHFFPEKLSVIVLSNLLQFSPSRIARQLSDWHFGKKIAYRSPIRFRKNNFSGDLPVFKLQNYVGRYRNEAMDIEHKIELLNGSLAIRLGGNGDPKILLYSKKEHAFSHGGFRLNFEGNHTQNLVLSMSSGRVTGIKFYKLE